MAKRDFDLDPGQWATLRRLLDDGLELDPPQRAAWLDTLDGAWADFKPRLRALLEHAPGTAQLMMNTLPKVETADFAPAQPEAAPERIGPYRLLRELGSGGMASVWLAERTDMLQGRQVALKLPHGAWRRAGLAERMAREREILATLNHPNIASLFDAGVAEDGQPYLALEYVDGERIDAYCTRHSLDVPARLRLYLQAARAVAHAHAHLVVHRDLKPNNILVNGQGEVRLLDFGIAKLLDQGVAAETELTQQAGRALTPDYASPEQIRGEAIGTASDVYSLGVVLFELLTGARPYRREHASRDALEQAVLHAEPKRPSAAVTDQRLARALRGDLDTIVAKALKKDAAQRYATVDALADDVARHLDRRPVLARPDSTLYRLGRLLQRNRLATGAAVAVTVAVLAGSGVALWQAQQARAEQRRAESVKDFMTALFDDVDAYAAPNSKPTVQELLQQARARLQGDFVGQPALRVELLLTLANGLAGLADFEAAESMLRQALDEGVPALGPRHLLVMRTRVGMADVLRFRGRIPEMQAELETVRADMDATPGVPVKDRMLLLENVTHLAINQGRYADAEVAAREVGDLAARHYPKRHVLQVMALMLVGLAASYSGDHERSLAASAEAAALAKDVFGSERPHARVFDARALHARALGNFGRYREAADELADVVAGVERLLGAANPMVGYYSADVARFRLEHGDLANGLVFAERAVNLLSPTTQGDPYTAAILQFNVGRAQLALRRPTAALQTLLSAREHARQSRGPTSALAMDVSAHVAVASAQSGWLDEAGREVDAGLAHWRQAKGLAGFRGLHHAGIVRRLARDWTAASALQQEALALLDDKPQHALRRSVVATERALIALEQGDAAAALGVLEAQFDPGRNSPVTTPAAADRLLAFGRSQLTLGRPAQAEAPLRAADAYWQAADPLARWAGEAAYWLGRCHAMQGRRAEAKVALARSARILVDSPFASDRALR